MTYSVEIRITSDPKLLRVVRATTEQICSIIGLANLDCHKIVLAVDEACSNVIRHSIKGKRVNRSLSILSYYVPDWKL